MTAPRLGAAALAVVVSVTAVAAADPPKIVLILADDVGREAIGAYGGSSYRTPRIDALARDGLCFRHAYSMPVCHPTRIALLTGRYPFRLRRPEWGSFPAAERERTVAHVLRRTGYATAIAGKWQLGLLRENPQRPHELGFDAYCLFGWHEGPRYYEPLIWQNGRIRDDVKDSYGPDVYTDFLIEFMERERERPFFAFYSMALCHDVTDDLDEPVPYGPGKDRYDSYAEMVESMDRMVGRIVSAVDRLGLREETLILFAGDNGTPARSIARVVDGKLVREPVASRRGDRLIPGGKGELLDTGTRVPFIARWPGTVAPGEVTDDLVDASDFLPAFAELAGAPLPEGIRLDGRSFAARLRGGKGGAREWAFAERGKRCWVRTQRWKLYSDGALHDMEDDPLEARPVPRKDESPEAAKARSMLEKELETLGWDPSGRD